MLRAFSLHTRTNFESPSISRSLVLFRIVFFEGGGGAGAEEEGEGSKGGESGKVINAVGWEETQLETAPVKQIGTRSEVVMVVKVDILLKRFYAFKYRGELNQILNKKK